MLGACATRELVAPPLPESRVRVSSYAEMAYEPLVPNTTQTIEFDEKTSPIARFPDGLGVYAAFSMVPQTSKTALRVRTWLSSDWLPMATMVKPYVVFLDEEKQVIANIASFNSRTGQNFFKGSYREGYFNVPPGTRFLVVYSAASESDRMIVRSQNGNLWAIPNVYHGKIDLTQESVKE